MEKLYDRIDWNNTTSPALNDTNLNLMSKAMDDIDNRVVDIAGTVMETVPQIREDLEEAQDLLEDAEAISTHPPIIGQNGNWWTWDTTIEDYADSGIDAGVSLTIGTTSTLTPGSDATVTNSGTATDPILNFGIPAGVAGQNGADGADGADGVSPEVTIGTITGGHSVTITDADHPTGQTFNVMDGTNGQGVPASGTTGQVLTKASNADYDTTWTTPSGGSGGHTIINDAGTSMTQRTGLQFVGLNVTDDSGNDKTVVTAPTPDYVDIQYTSSASWIKGQTCISGNKRYRCKVNNTGSQYAPPNTTYWEELSVAEEIKQWNMNDAVLYGTLTNLAGSGEGYCFSGTINNPNVDVFDYTYMVAKIKGVVNDRYWWGAYAPIKLLQYINDGNDVGKKRATVNGIGVEGGNNNMNAHSNSMVVYVAMFVPNASQNSLTAAEIYLIK